MIEDGLEKADSVNSKTSEKKLIKKEVNIEQYKKLRAAIIEK